MPRNAAKFYADCAASSERYTVDPWVGMEAVERCIARRYGGEAGKITEALRAAERQRHAARNVTLHRIPGGRDIFTRNLRALAFMAEGKLRRDPAAVPTLYADALEDLTRIYPPEKHAGELNPYEVWKHLLDTARDEAAKE